MVSRWTFSTSWPRPKRLSEIHVLGHFEVIDIGKLLIESRAS
jgi:hypothetical protein